MLPDDLQDCGIYDLKRQKIIYPYDASHSDDHFSHPLLLVDAVEKIDIKVMSRFEILKKQLSEKVEFKQATSRRFTQPA